MALKALKYRRPRCTGQREQTTIQAVVCFSVVLPQRKLIWYYMRFYTLYQLHGSDVLVPSYDARYD